MNIEADLQTFISSAVLVAPPEGGIRLDEPLISSGLVDSLGLLKVIEFVQERYGVDVMTDAGPDDLESIEALAAAIRRIREDA